MESDTENSDLLARYEALKGENTLLQGIVVCSTHCIKAQKSLKILFFENTTNDTFNNVLLKF